MIGTLIGWHFFGANTSDDGYLLSMARASEHSGYMANYFRWFGVPEAPFGWYYDVLAAFAKISTASPWMRLPALLAAIVCWMVISREVVPRLGRAVRENRIALWTGGLVFLAFWLPYNNGLRPEPIVALGALLTWCSIERAIATGRLLPAATAVIIGAFTLAAAPTGLMCIAALIAGLRPMTRIVVRRHREVGTLPLLAPIGAAGVLVLVVVFSDQTLAAVLEATRVRTIIGPNEEWWNDFLRYYYLMVQTVDGSLARRFAFLVMLLCLFTTMLVLLRRRKIPGIAMSPSWRLLGIVFGTMFFMMFNPTKWTHHFGAYAGIAGSLAALTAVLVSASALRSRRNRTIFLAGLQGIPKEQYEASSVDGANKWQQFWNITIPNLKGTIKYVIMITMIQAMKLFTQPYVMTQGGPKNATKTMVYYIYTQGFQKGNFGYACSVAAVFFVIVVAMSLILQKITNAD